MEAGAALLVENLGASDGKVALVGNGILDVSDVKNELNERQLQEKLDKSEAGRKKLRQAIALLKEKLEVTSQALEVNKALRQEVEKERQSSIAERNRAEAEKLLREKLEKENLTFREQIVAVFQRLEYLETDRKADQDEYSRIRSEVKEAVGGVGAALHAVEATKALFQSLGQTLHAKINGAIQSSKKALDDAQSGQATATRAQSAASATQSLAKAVQKEVQLLASQVATLQKQGSNLSLLEASLQQDTQLRGPRTPLNSPESGEADVPLVVPKERVSCDALSPRISALPVQRTVRSKIQTEAQKGSQFKENLDDGDILNSLVASTEKSRNNLASPSIGLPPRGGILSRSQLPDGGLKSQASIPQVRHAAISPRKGSSDNSITNPPLSQSVSSFGKTGPVAVITGLESILSPAVNHLSQADSAIKTAPSLYITAPIGRTNSIKNQGESQSQKFLEAPKELGSRDHPSKRPVVKRGRGEPAVTGCSKPMELLDGCSLKCNHSSKNSAGFTSPDSLSRRPTTSKSGHAFQNAVYDTLVVEADERFSDVIPESNGKPHPNTTTGLMKSIVRMFEKESKNRKNMEEKLLRLQVVLENHCDPGKVAQIGPKRKRENRKEKDEGTSEQKGRKRHRQGKDSKKKVSNFIAEDAVTSQGERPCITEDKHLLQENVTQEKERQALGNCHSAHEGLLEMLSAIPSIPSKADSSFETNVGCYEIVSDVQERKDVSEVDPCNTDVSKEGTGRDTDLESTDDDFGEDWWAKKVLLSPISNGDLAS